MSAKILQDFNKAIKKLEEVLAVDKNEIVRDSAIKRFELCFDLAWKSVKNYAKQQGVECYSPRGCFKAAYQLKLVDDHEAWLAVVDDRNLTAHLYSEEKANEAYSRLGGYVRLFQDLAKRVNRVDV
jgi:nucleotidyltransferase substrate binding protein (TIGR01987 family)